MVDTIPDSKIDLKQLNLRNLVKCILPAGWMHDCEILVNTAPPLPEETIKPACVVRYEYPTSGNFVFLKYSDGPLPGYYWGIDGDEFFCPEVALLSLSRSPPPSILQHHIDTLL